MSAKMEGIGIDWILYILLQIACSDFSLCPGFQQKHSPGLHYASLGGVELFFIINGTLLLNKKRKLLLMER